MEGSGLPTLTHGESPYALAETQTSSNSQVDSM